MFTHENTDGFSRQELEILNVALDEAWGALKDCAARIDLDAAQLRGSLSDAICNEWISGISAEALAERALTRIGFKPVRDIYSLECVRPDAD